MANDFGQQSSPFQDAGEANPYQASAYPGMELGAGGTAQRSLPVFVVVMMVISIVLCVIRLLLALAGVGALVAGLVNVPTAMMYSEVAINFIAAITGIVAGGLILAKRGSGIPLAWIHVASILISIGISVFQAFEKFNAVGANMPDVPEMLPAMRVGFVIGAGLVVIFRLVIISLYISAVTKFSRWLREDGRPAGSGYSPFNSL